jgi:hypothetical protein
MMNRATLALALAGAAAALSSCGGHTHHGAAIPPGSPAIGMVVPGSGPVRATITISGTDFEQSPAFETVFFDDAEAPIQSGNPAEIVVAVPAGVGAGQHEITVTTRRGTSAGVSFTVTDGPAGDPTVSNITPVVGAPGTTVTVTGTNFAMGAGASTVLLDNQSVPASVASTTSLSFVVPPGARSGKVAVSAGGTDSTSGESFFVTSAAAPKSLGTVGQNNRNYVTASPFTSLVIEVDVQSGITPPQASAIAAYAQVITARLFKPGGVTILAKPTFTPITTGAWTDPLIAQQEAAVRTAYDGPNTATLHFLFLGQSYAAASGVIGLTFTASSIAIFEQQVPGINPAARADIEAPVMIHENGHALGLVDITTPMQTPHEDPTSPGHDVLNTCVMFREIDVPSNLQALLTNPPPKTFDPHCIEDLQAIGGR